MSTELNEMAQPEKYRVERVEKTTRPEGIPNGEWFRYVIGQGRSRIEGCKAGTLKEVTRHAESVAEDLNNRAANGYSAYAPRRR